MTALIQYGRSGPETVSRMPADERPDHPGQVLDRLQEGVRARQVLVRDEVRQAGVHGRPEEARGNAGDTGQRDDRDRRFGEGQGAEDREADEVGADHQPPAREPVDERTEGDAENDDRQELRDQERAHPRVRARAVEDVDRQRDGGEVRPRARAERGEEEPPEVRSPPEQGETTVGDAGHGRKLTPLPACSQAGMTFVRSRARTPRFGASQRSASATGHPLRRA